MLPQGAAVLTESRLERGKGETMRCTQAPLSLLANVQGSVEVANHVLE